MSNELYGLFETREAANQTAKLLIKDGFSRKEIKVEDYEAPNRMENETSNGKTPSLLRVTAVDPKERQKVFGVLAMSGASNLDPKAQRIQENRAAEQAESKPK
jgi:hypothetical protein